MRRPAGVIVAAVVLGLMTLLGLLGTVASMAVWLFLKSPLIPKVPALRATVIAVDGLAICFFLFCAWTVVDLFRMRKWARYSILALGGLLFVISGLLCVAMIVARNYAPPLPGGPSPVSMQAVMLGIAAFYGVGALIGVWWLVYFSLRPVREAFAGAAPGGEAAEGSGWQVVLTVWAWLLLICVLLFPFVLWMHTPLFVLGFLVRGAAAVAVTLVLIALAIFIGLGLLRKWKAAWYAAVAWQIYSLATMVSFLLPGVRARFASYQVETMERWGVPAISTGGSGTALANGPFLALGVIVGLMAIVLISWALVRRRGDYLGAQPARV